MPAHKMKTAMAGAAALAAAIAWAGDANNAASRFDLDIDSSSNASRALVALETRMAALEARMGRFEGFFASAVMGAAESPAEIALAKNGSPQPFVELGIRLKEFERRIGTLESQEAERASFTALNREARRERQNAPDVYLPPPADAAASALTAQVERGQRGMELRIDSLERAQSNVMQQLSRIEMNIRDVERALRSPNPAF